MSFRKARYTGKKGFPISPQSAMTCPTTGILHRGSGRSSTFSISKEVRSSQGATLHLETIRDASRTGFVFSGNFFQLEQGPSESNWCSESSCLPVRQPLQRCLETNLSCLQRNGRKPLIPLGMLSLAYFHRSHSIGTGWAKNWVSFARLYTLLTMLDGVRAYWDGANFYSRNGIRYHAPKFFREALPKVPLDGELWYFFHPLFPF